ncbi:MAG: type VI secretion system tube protein Hcp, partial [Alphaproteobacteria bacterium]|nr:type VI secretion system tube protein Hcp [Alphaproteobacteria bacterium]
MTKLCRLGSAMLILGVLAFAAGTTPAGAAGFIKFDGIDGEAEDKNHKQWSDILSVQFGDGQTGARMPSGSSAEPMMGSNKELIITKRPDRSSPALHKACSSGKHFDDAVLHVRKAGRDAAPGSAREVYLVYEMKD